MSNLETVFNCILFQLRLKVALTNNAEILQNLIVDQYVNCCGYNFIYLLSFLFSRFFSELIFLFTKFQFLIWFLMLLICTFLNWTLHNSCPTMNFSFPTLLALVIRYSSTFAVQALKYFQTFYYGDKNLNLHPLPSSEGYLLWSLMLKLCSLDFMTRLCFSKVM